MSNFEQWLQAKLNDLKADVSVFLPYITSLLENEEEEEESVVTDSLVDTLESITGESRDFNSSLAKKIIDRWRESENGDSVRPEANVAQQVEKLDLGAQLAQITATQSAAYTASRASAAGSSNAPDKSVKEAILAQYAGTVEESSDEESDTAEDTEPRNTNAEAVAKAEQEKREKSKAAAKEKKEKDKEDREKQKQQAEDRKKKAQEKTAKGERRR